MDLSVTVSDHGPLTVLHVAGEIDLHTAPRLGEALDEQIAAGRTELVVDLEDVMFLESTGLGVLLERLRLAQAHRGTIRLVSTHARILKVFTITGLDKVFEIYDSVEDAAASVGRGAESLGEPADATGEA